MSAVVEFGFSAAPVFSGVDRLEGKLKGLDRAVSGLTGISLSSLLPAAGLAGAVGGIRSLMSNMDDLADTALRLNESTDVIQRVTHASEILASVDAEGVTNNFLKLEKALGEVGNEKASKALADLGLTAESLTRMPLDEKVIAFADAFNTARATGTGYNDILNLLGKSAGDLIPMFAQGGEALRTMFDGAPVVIDSTVQRLAAANDQLDSWSNHLKVASAEAIGSALSLGGALFDIGKGLFDGKDLSTISAEMSAAQQAAVDAQAAAQEKTKASKESAAEGLKAAAAAEAEAEAAKKTAATHDKIVEAQARLDEQKHKAGLDEMSTAKKIATLNVDLQAAAADEAALRSAAVRDEEKIIAAESKKVTLQTELNGLQEKYATEKERAAEATKREAEQQRKAAEAAEQAAITRRAGVLDTALEYQLLQAKARHNTKAIEEAERNIRVLDRASRLEEQNGLSKRDALALSIKMTDLEDRANGKRGKIHGVQSDPLDPQQRHGLSPFSGGPLANVGTLSTGGPISRNGGLNGFWDLQAGNIGSRQGASSFYLKNAFSNGQSIQAHHLANAAGGEADRGGNAAVDIFLDKLVNKLPPALAAAIMES